MSVNLIHSLKKPDGRETETEAHPDNRQPPSVLSGRVSHSSSEDRRVQWSRKLSTVWVRLMTRRQKMIARYY